MPEYANSKMTLLFSTIQSLHLCRRMCGARFLWQPWLFVIGVLATAPVMATGTGTAVAAANKTSPEKDANVKSTDETMRAVDEILKGEAEDPSFGLVGIRTPAWVLKPGIDTQRIRIDRDREAIHDLIL